MNTNFVEVNPPGLESLACSYAHPQGWSPVEIPAEDIDFNIPNRFMAIAICAAGFAFGVFSVGVRPAYEDGTLDQWVAYVCGAESVEITAMAEATVSGYEARRVNGRQQTEEGDLVISNLFVRAGDRFYAVSGTTLEALSASMAPVLDAMLDSFALRA